MNQLSDNLIIIGSTLPYDFPADYIKKTAETLSKNNFVIVFLWGNALSVKEMFLSDCKQRLPCKVFEKKGKVNLFYPIHFLPFRRFLRIREINLKINIAILNLFILCKQKNRLRKILWIFNYELYKLPEIMTNVDISLYDCVEYSSSLDKEINRKIRMKERKLIENIDLFFVDSPTLRKRFSEYSPAIVPQGFDLDTFKVFNKTKMSTINLDIKKPMIGYVGSINYRLNYKLLFDLARKSPYWSFVFVGPKQANSSEDKYVSTDYWQNKLFKLDNVIYFDNQPKKIIPSIISQFDICLIPYDVNIEFNKYSRAMKVYEYFYMEKPVLSTRTLESERLKPLITVADNAKDFYESIHKILKNGWSADKAKKQKSLAVSNSWKAKVNYILKYLNKYQPKSVI